MAYGEVYVVTCSVNGKQYVGQTTQGAWERWCAHQEEARGGRGRLLARAIRKYGIENFRMEIADTATSPEDLNAKEIALIAGLNSRSPHGYNLMEGGSNGKHSEESRAKMSLSQSLRRHPDELKEKIRRAGLGRKLSDEAKAKISAANKGKVRSPEAREKYRKAKQGTRPSPQAHEAARLVNKGKKRSHDAVEATRLANIGRQQTPEHREKNRLGHLGQRRSPDTIAKWRFAMGKRVL
jgi:group I intron endonuclease